MIGKNARYIAVAVIAIVLIAAACSSTKMSAQAPTVDTAAAKATTPKTGSTAVTAQTDESLGKLLVAPEDIPTGYTPVAQNMDATSAYCPVATAAKIPRVARAATAYEASSSGSLLGEIVSAYAPGDASKVIAAIKDMVGACAIWEDGAKEFHLTQVTTPQIGDEAIGFQLTVDDPASTAVVGEFAYVRHGDIVATVAMLGYSPTPVAVSDQFVKAVLTKVGINI